MTIHLKHNPYVGLNAHHLSLLTYAKLWQGFHLTFIAEIRRALRLVLPSNYIVSPELSLQLLDPNGGLPVQTRGDVVISHIKASPPILRGENLASPTREYELQALYTSDDYLGALLIYERANLGQPVTRLEVLSPANKPPSTYHHAFWEKRRQTLMAGINLVEVDFLHELPSLLTLVSGLDFPNYVAGDADAKPYHLILSYPHPSLAEGRVSVYEFGVDEPVPVMPIPLVGEEYVPFDFGLAYQVAFELDDAAHYQLDYEQLPMNFESYHPADQERIRQRMNRIVESKV